MSTVIAYVFKVLVDNGADVNAKNKRGQAPLTLATVISGGGHLDVISFLKQHGAKE